MPVSDETDCGRKNFNVYIDLGRSSSVMAGYAAKLLLKYKMLFVVTVTWHHCTVKTDRSIGFRI
jgi:hypothetical protein